ncbi:MAG: hypothetical protein AVDCRST_MAG59-2614, partial [uncultured Thermomicrobiales bacterium]
VPEPSPDPGRSAARSPGPGPRDAAGSGPPGLPDEATATDTSGPNEEPGMVPWPRPVCLASWGPPSPRRSSRRRRARPRRGRRL